MRIILVNKNVFTKKIIINCKINTEDVFLGMLTFNRGDSIRYDTKKRTQIFESSINFDG